MHPELGSVRVGTAPVGIAVSPDGCWIIANDSNRFGGRGGGGSLALVPASAFGQQAAPPRRALAAGGFPGELRLSPGGATLAVTNFSTGAVEFIDLAPPCLPELPRGAGRRPARGSATRPTSAGMQ
ncbi:MAG: hypothetical protein ACRD1M_09460 [Terriglobales bacterium]